MSEEATMLQDEEGTINRTGGPARSQQRVIFVSDTLCVSSESCFPSSCAPHLQPGVIAVIGDIVEGPMRKKVVVLWVSRDGINAAPARHDGRLHLQDASNIMELETNQNNEKFTSISLLRCPTMPRYDPALGSDDNENTDREDSQRAITVVVIACSESRMYRWTLQLDEPVAHATKKLDVNVADVGRYLQKLRPWRSVSAPLVTHAVSIPQERRFEGCRTLCSIGDCNENVNVEAWSAAVVLSANIEGANVLIRDNQLSVVCAISASSYFVWDEDAPPSSPTSSPFRVKTNSGPSHGSPTHVVVTTVNNRAACFISYENGAFSVWDLEPCVRISDEDLANEALNLSSLQPILLFDERFAYEISVFSVLQSVRAAPEPSHERPTGAGRRGKSERGTGSETGSHEAEAVVVPVLVGSRDGRLRKVHLGWSSSGGTCAAPRLYTDDAQRAGQKNNQVVNMSVKEVYNIDLAKETRYLEASMQKNAVSGTGMGQGALPKDMPAQVKHNFSCIPLALSLAPAGGGGGVCQAVTTQAILTLRLEDLKVMKSVALSSLGDMAGGVATKALSDAAVSSFASLIVSAFDKQVRVYYFGAPENVDSAQASGIAKVVGSSIPKAKRHITAEAGGASGGVSALQVASAHDTLGSSLSLFLTAADISIISGPDSGEEEEVGFAVGAAGGTTLDETGKHTKVSPLAAPNTAPPPTPAALRGASAKSTSPSKNPNTWETPQKDKKSGKILNQPVTFHSRIKSSGYGQSPQGALEKMEKKRKEKNLAIARERQKETLSRSVTAPARSGASASTGGTAGANAAASNVPRLRRYPVDCAAITVHQAHNQFTAASMAGPLHRVSFNGDGSLFGVATSDSTVSTLKAPISRFGGDGTFYMSHNGPVTNIQFSHQRTAEKQLVLSSSTDGTARLWRTGKVDYSAVCFTHDKHSTGSSHITTTTTNMSSRNRPYTGAVVDASFYYNDRFVSLANGNRAFIYTYSCDGTDAKNDLKRLQSNGSYRRAHEWSFSEAKSVTALANINSVLSPLLFCATSDRKLHVLDAARGAVVRSIDAPHERAMHCIALPQPSVYAQLDASSYNVFATAAMDNCINIWDMRSPSVAGRYTGHVNRREHVRCALSPCLRYLACGSEDKAARLVDLRTATEVARYTGHRDVVSDVAFHPILPQLATASYDGNVSFYCSKDANLFG